MRWSSMILRAAAASSRAGDGARVEGHALAGGVAEDGAVVGLQEAAEVAVRDAAGEPPLGVDHGGDPQPLPGHLVDRLAHRRVEEHLRQRVPRVHELIDFQELLAELAGGVELGEVLAGEPPRLDERHGEGVPHGEGGGGGGRGREPQRAGLAVDRHRQVEVGVAGERGRGVGGHRHQGDAQALERLDQPHQLLGGAGVGGGEHHVARHEHPEVAVHGLGGMEEEGRGAGRGEGGGHLLHHQAALAHPRADHPAGAAAQQLDGPVEVLVELRDQAADRRGLGLQHLGGDLAGRSPPLPVREGGGDGRGGRRVRAHQRLPHRDQRRQQPLRPLGVELHGGVGAGVLGVGVDLQEDAVRAGRHRRPGQRLGVAPQAPALGAAAGELERVGDVVDHRDAVLVEHGEAAHVHHQVVVPERDAPLGHGDLLVAGRARLLDDPQHVVRGHELPLLDVHRPAGPRRGHHEVGLAAEEGGDLEHVADLGGRRALVRLVDVGDHREAGLLLDEPQHPHPLREARAAEASDRAAVGLVEGGLEDQRHAEALGHRGQHVGRLEHQVLALDHARAGDDGERMGAGAADHHARRQLDESDLLLRGDRHQPWTWTSEGTSGGWSCTVTPGPSERMRGAVDGASAGSWLRPFW